MYERCLGIIFVENPFARGIRDLPLKTNLGNVEAVQPSYFGQLGMSLETCQLSNKQQKKFSVELFHQCTDVCTTAYYVIH